MNAHIHYIDIGHGGEDPRLTAQVGRLTSLAVSRYGERADAVDQLRVAMWQEAEARNDAAAPANGYHLTRDLEHVYSEILQEPIPEFNAFRLFAINTEVSPYARTHTIRRVEGSGRAAVHRGRGQSIPRVGVSSREESFGVDRFVTSFATDMWERGADSLSGLPPIVPSLMRQARRAVDQLMNWQTWYGNPDTRLPGVLTYPWLRKKVIATAFNDSTSDPADIVRALHDLVDFAYLSEKQVFKPDTLVVSPRVGQYLRTTLVAPSADARTTIADRFLSESKFISSIEEAWELQNDDASNPLPNVPTGLDCILAYRRDVMGIQNTVPQGFTMIAPQTRDFEDVTLCWAAHGGVIMREVGNNILGFVTPPSL